MKVWQIVSSLTALAIMGFAIEKGERAAAAARDHRPAEEARAAAPGAESPPSPPRAKNEVSSVATRNKYQAVFAAEGADAAWSALARQRAKSRLEEDLPPGSVLRAIDCRTTMCRIETSHPDFGHYQAFIRKAFMDPSSSLWNAPTFSTALAAEVAPGPGPTLVVSYIAREGGALPPPE